MACSEWANETSKRELFYFVPFVVTSLLHVMFSLAFNAENDGRNANPKTVGPSSHTPTTLNS